MGFRLFFSSRTDILSSRLSDELKEIKKNPFELDYIITQNEGLNKWLSLQIAEKNKIFTSFKFLKPNGLVTEIFRLAGISTAEEFKTEKVRWMVYRALQNEDFLAKHKIVERHLENDDVKRIQLATKISDLFDQYLIYRPDYIELWDNNENIPVSNEDLKQHADWQKDIWRNINEEYQIENKVFYGKLLNEKFKDESFLKRLQQKFQQISIFGVSIITPFHLDLFTKLAEHIMVDFYLFNPAPNEYWYDQTSKKSIIKIERFTKKSSEELLLNSGNDLLSNWGKVGKDLFNQLLESSEQLELINLDEKFQIEPVTLLSKVKSDIFNNTIEANKSLINNLFDDKSLKVVSNFSELREVEELFVHLNDLFRSRNHSLRDVLVVVPDIKKYAPFITAVFDNSSLKYTITDNTYANQESVSKALEYLLKFSLDDFNIISVLDLLRNKVIRETYGIENIALIEQVLSDTNFRFSIKGSEEDQSNLVDFEQAVNKIIYGYCFADESISIHNRKVFPYHGIKEKDYLELFKFLGFAKDLIKILSKRPSFLSLKEWSEYLTSEILSKLFSNSDDYLEELLMINEHLALLIEVDNPDEKISFETFRRAFLDSLVNNVKTAQYISGRITFCSMIPLRGVPFKTVAILGLNLGDFPRHESKYSYDLNQIDRRRGDRDIREGDRYLFLETLFSAQENLYLSYCGRDIKDLSDKIPSSVIDELLEYINKGDSLETNLVEKKSLAPQHILSKGLDQVHYKEVSKEIPSATDFEKITVRELTNLFSDPYSYFAKKQLSVNYYIEDYLELQETEMFELDNKLKQFQVRRFVDQKEDIDFNEYLKSVGYLPLSNQGNLAFKKINDELDELDIKIKSFGFSPPIKSEKYSFETNSKIIIESEEVLLEEGKLIDWTFSAKSSTAKKMLPSWLSYLVLRANAFEVDYIFINKNEAKDIRVKFTDITVTDAVFRLNQLVEWFVVAQQRPLRFSTALLKTGGYPKFIENLANQPSFNLYSPIALNKGFYSQNLNELFDEQEVIESLLFKIGDSLLLRKDQFN